MRTLHKGFLHIPSSAIWPFSCSQKEMGIEIGDEVSQNNLLLGREYDQAAEVKKNRRKVTR